jgi:hypothetical protein
MVGIVWSHMMEGSSEEGKGESGKGPRALLRRRSEKPPEDEGSPRWGFERFLNL